MATSVTFQFWRSADDIDWSDGPYSDIADVPDARYIKVRVTLARDDEKTPVLEDMTVGYFKKSNILANWIFFNETAKDIDLTCPMCQERIGGVCVNIPAGEKDLINGCTATHYRCDGNGNCTAPTHEFWSPCLNWHNTGNIPGRNDCKTWCQNHGYIDCVEPGTAYYLWDEHCGTLERYYSCQPGIIGGGGEWSAADDGRSWKCRCKDYVYD